MASVTFPEALGGNGQTYTDDADPNTGLDGLGYTIRFIPCLQQAVAMGLSAKNDAQAADGFVQQCQTLRQETATDRQAVAEDRAAVEQHLQDAQARIGTTQALIDARDTALAAQAGAEDAETGAVAAQTSAEAARDAAVVSGQVYPDTSAGLTATSDGQYFKTVAANQAGFLTLWRNNAGVATEIETYPSLTGIAQALEQANRKQTRLARSLQRLGDHGQTLHSDFDLDAHGLGTALVGGVQDALEAEELWTVGRLSGTLAYQHTDDGSLKYVEVPANTLAREWNPETGEYQTQRTDMVTNNVTDSAIYKVGGLGTQLGSGSIDSPISGMAGYKVTETTTSGEHYLADHFESISVGDRNVYFSLTREIDGGEKRYLMLRTAGGNSSRVIFDIDGLTYNVTQNLVANLDAGIIPLGDKWALCWVAVEAASEAASGFFRRQITTSATGGDVYVGDGVSGLWFSNFQVQEGTTPGPIIVTEGAPVTRVEDSIRRDVEPVFNTGALTLEAWFYYPEPNGKDRVVFGADDGLFRRYFIEVSASGVVRTRIIDDSSGSAVSYVINLPGDFSPGDTVKCAVSHDGTLMAAAANGQGGEAYNAPRPVLARWWLGRRAAGDFFNGAIIFCSANPNRKTLAQLQELTSL